MPYRDPYTGKIEHESANPGFSLPYPTTDSGKLAQEAKTKEETQYYGGNQLADQELKKQQADLASAQADRTRNPVLRKSSSSSRDAAGNPLSESSSSESYARGGAVKSDPRASRRMYAKGGPIFR